MKPSKKRFDSDPDYDFKPGKLSRPVPPRPPPLVTCPNCATSSLYRFDDGGRGGGSYCVWCNMSQHYGD